MDEQNKKEQSNKTPSKMARLAWPKAKYGLVLAILIIIVVNIIYYKDSFYHFFKKYVKNIKWQKTYIKLQKQKK